MSKYGVLETVTLAGVGVRGNYPKSLRIFVKAHSPYWVAEFYATKEDLGMQNAKRGKRVCASTGVKTDFDHHGKVLPPNKEAFRRAIAWARSKTEGIKAVAEERIILKSTFRHYAEELKKDFQRRINKGLKSKRAWYEHELRLTNGKGTGILQQAWADWDINEIGLLEIRRYFEDLSAKYGDKQIAAIKTTMRAVYERAMEVDFPDLDYPRFPKIKSADRYTTYFTGGEWNKLLLKCRQLAGKDAAGKWLTTRILTREEFLSIPHNEKLYKTQRNFLELYHLLTLFGQTFIRAQDLYRLRVETFAPSKDKNGIPYLAIRLSETKTGTVRETTASTERAIEYWKRSSAYAAKPDSYLFFDHYERPKDAVQHTGGTMLRAARDCFKFVLNEAGLEKDRFGNSHTLTSVRHTCFMLFLERNEGKVDLKTLALNGHTSVEMLESTYLVHIQAKRRIKDFQHGSSLK